MMETSVQKSWRAHADAAAWAFRLGMEGVAGAKLAAMIDALNPVLLQLEPERLRTLLPALEETLAAQSRKDWIRIADLLEYVVVPGIEKLP